MEKKFAKNFYAKNNYERYFHREYIQTKGYHRNTFLTPDFRRQNNTKKPQHKYNQRRRDAKYNYNIKIIVD